MKKFSRRAILQQGAAATTMLQLNLAGRAAANSNGASDDRKSLVCIYFAGGLDSYHVLVPRDDSRYNTYQESRTNIAHPKQRLVPINEVDGGKPGELYGLHPDCGKLADMFNGEGAFAGKRRASWLANVGTLIKPLTLEQYREGRPGIDIPVGVGGHVRQAEQWQTAQPEGTVQLKGWLGRAADLLGPEFNRARASMNLSLAGNNIMQLGDDTRPFSFNPFLGLGLSGRTITKADDPRAIKNLLHQKLIEQRYQRNFTEDTFSEISSFSLGRQIEIQAALDAVPDSTFAVPFNGNFQRRLAAVAKLIISREAQGLCRQTFFVQAPRGWDDHFQLGKDFDERIKETSEGISVFQQNMEALGLSDSVLGFTTSEFARTLRSTSFGSDHAWGGPQMIFGGPVDAGKVFGDFPDQTLNGADDTGRGGRILPSRGCDEYFADLLRWFGLADEDLEIALPNYGNFLVDGRTPINFLKA